MVENGEGPPSPLRMLTAQMPTRTPAELTMREPTDMRTHPAWTARVDWAALGLAPLGPRLLCDKLAIDVRTHVCRQKEERRRDDCRPRAASAGCVEGKFEPLARAATRLLSNCAPHASFVIARSAWFEDLQPTLVAYMEVAGLLRVSEFVDAGEGATVLEFRRAS